MRRLHDLVSVYPEQASTSTTGTVKSKGVFITIESLLTFPGASTSVVIIWKVLGAVVPGWGQSAVVPVVTSFRHQLLFPGRKRTRYRRSHQLV